MEQRCTGIIIFKHHKLQEFLDIKKTFEIFDKLKNNIFDKSELTGFLYQRTFYNYIMVHGDALGLGFYNLQTSAYRFK